MKNGPDATKSTRGPSSVSPRPPWFQGPATPHEITTNPVPHPPPRGPGPSVPAAFLAHGVVALRDSKNPDKPAHIFDDVEYDTFIAGIMRGELRRT